jgi:branched-chain amino acid transport system permease protein
VLNGSSAEFYYLLVGLLGLTYLFLRYLVNSRFGLVLVAIREEPDRAEQLGYDIRFAQLIVFSIAAGLAGLSGLFYVSWGAFITPSVFGVTANILPVIWVAVAGRKCLLASIVGAVLIQWATQELAIRGEYALVVQGLLLTLVVMVLPDGFASIFMRRWRRRSYGGGAVLRGPIS